MKSPTLTSLNCYSNKLKTLDVTNCPELTSLDCRYNLLTQLDLSKNTKLTSTSTTQNTIDVEMVKIAANQVGFALDKSFNSTNVVELKINYDKYDPKFVTVDGVQYFIVYDNAADVTKDDKVDITDVTSIIDIILGK